MFTIVISEKGGAERRETFDKNEISVGRIQGNDLVLSKGNVSKHHARLLSRDGRFIVTDLKSTNGTYVNGRKTSQATIVREGDKIYVGDFVLRIEIGQSSPQADGAQSEPGLARGPLASGHQFPQEPSGVGGSAASAVSVPPAPPDPPGSQAHAPLRPMESQRVSHYPLEHDPDSESHPEIDGVSDPQGFAPPRVSAAELRPPRPVSPIAKGAPSPLARGTAATASPGRSPVVSREAPRETHAQTAARAALTSLAERVAHLVDTAQLDVATTVAQKAAEEIERIVREQALAMKAAGAPSDSFPLDTLVRQMTRELVGLGPLTDPLEDADVSEIHVARPDRVFLKKGGSLVVGDSFTNERAIARVLARLVGQSVDELTVAQPVIARRLPFGVLTAIGPPVTSHWVLTLRRSRRIEATLAGLTGSGAISRGMAVFLEACVGARANVLAVGPSGNLSASVLSALASAAGPSERVAILEDQDEIAVTQVQVFRAASSGGTPDAIVRAIARMGVDRFVVASLAGEVMGALLEVMAEGRDGVLAGMTAPSLRQGLARLASRASAAGHAGAVGAEAIAACFDVVIEVVQGTDGKIRIAKIAEPDGVEAATVLTRDLFVSTTDGAGQVAFAVSGNTPRIAEAFAARGIRVDAALFRRAR